MTKVVKWWKTFSFWNKIRMLLISLGTGGEVTLFLMESYPKWKIVAAIATIGSVIITYGFVDSNNNGIVDAFERFKKNK